MLSYCCAYTQSVSEVFRKVADQYGNNKPLQYKSSYTLYKDFDSKKIEESYSGIFYKNEGNEIYTKIGDTEIINLKAAFLKVSHPEKTVEILNPMQNYSGNFDIKPLLDLCKIEKFLEYKSYWEITMITKQYSSLPYSKIIVQVSKDYFLHKQIFYYNTAVNFSKDYRSPDSHYPRLEVTHSNYNRNPAAASVFNSKTYFIVSEKKKIILSERFKNYEIID